jgi:hypothetical protein
MLPEFELILAAIGCTVKNTPTSVIVQYFIAQLSFGYFQKKREFVTAK